MRVMIVVGGKFYALQLAEQMEKRGHLHRLITSHPLFALHSQTVPPWKIVSFPVAEVVGQGLNRLTRSNHGDYWKAVLLDRFASVQRNSCDAVFGFASFCLTTMRRRKRSCSLLLERACPHVLDQVERLREEADRLGSRYSADERVIDRMLAEYDLADVIIVPSRFSQNSFLAHGVNPKKVQVVPLSGKFPPPAHVPDRTRQVTFRLLFVGGNFLRKGLMYLLRAWDGLRLKDAELVLRAADLPDIPEVHRLLKNPSIKQMSYQADLGRLYSEASAFCLPSIDEGFGMVVLEAMSYGLPVIVTENVGASDCVRNGTDGFILPIRDVQALQEKILHLYEHPEERRVMGEAASGQSSLFSWDAYGDKINRLLLGLPCGSASESR